MKRLVSVAAIFLTTSSAYAITCATLPDCSSLGYTDTVTDCPNDYVSCPMDMTLGTCLNRAIVGRIGFFPKNPNGTTSGAYKGWLFLDGDFYNKDMYPELYSLLVTKYGGGGSVFKLPDFRGDYIQVDSSDGTTAKLRIGESLPNIKATWRSMFEDKDIAHAEYKYNNLVISTAYDDISGTASEIPKSAAAGYAIRTFDASKSSDVWGASSHVTPVHTPVYAYIYAGKKVASASSSASVISGCAEGYYYYTDGTCSATRNTSKFLRGIVYSANSSNGSVSYIWGGGYSEKTFKKASDKCKERIYDASVISPSTAATYLAKASGASFVSPVYAISTSRTYWSSSSSVYSCSSTTSCSTSSTPIHGTNYYYYCQATDYYS